MSISNQDRENILLKFREESLLGGGKEKIQKQHQQGKLTARERILRLLDFNSFNEIDSLNVHHCTQFEMDKNKILGDGVITGFGKINGKDVAIFSQDFTCWGGALGVVHAQKICKIMDMAVANKMPIIGINDSGGARIQEGVESLAGYAEIFYRNVQASGIVPQISLIFGPCAGGAVYSPAITDFIFMVEKTSYMFVTGPDVIKTVTHEEITKEALGGSQTHNSKSGVAHFSANNEDNCFERVRELLHFIPSSNAEPIAKKKSTDNAQRKSLNIKKIIPDNIKKPYDVREIITDIFDSNHFMEVHKDFAQNIVVGFATLDGINVGVVANQPNFLAGVLDIDASTKAARFVRFCDCFNIPIITLVDVPGFLPGSEQEHNGIIRHGAKLLYAFAEATVPLITLILRKAYGGAYDVMSSKHIRSDINLALPTAEIAVMGAEGAVNIIFRKELEGLSTEQVNLKRKQLIDAYEQEFASPYKAAELGYLDEVILPDEVRSKLTYYLNLLKNKKVTKPFRKHGNIPL
jgi:propionyl-CoA carboxylase beta chain